ncbi:hypothetical protein ACVNIS_10705 [Sphaerotilaceae bacterium SBD11-9]
MTNPNEPRNPQQGQGDQQRQPSQGNNPNAQQEQAGNKAGKSQDSGGRDPQQGSRERQDDDLDSGKQRA